MLTHPLRFVAASCLSGLDGFVLRFVPSWKGCVNFIYRRMWLCECFGWSQIQLAITPFSSGEFFQYFHHPPLPQPLEPIYPPPPASWTKIFCYTCYMSLVERVHLSSHFCRRMVNFLARLAQVADCSLQGFGIINWLKLGLLFVQRCNSSPSSNIQYFSSSHSTLTGVLDCLNIGIWHGVGIPVLVLVFPTGEPNLLHTSCSSPSSRLLEIEWANINFPCHMWLLLWTFVLWKCMIHIFCRILPTAERLNTFAYIRTKSQTFSLGHCFVDFCPRNLLPFSVLTNSFARRYVWFCGVFGLQESWCTLLAMGLSMVVYERAAANIRVFEALLRRALFAFQLFQPRIKSFRLLIFVLRVVPPVVFFAPR